MMMRPAWLSLVLLATLAACADAPPPVTAAPEPVIYVAPPVVVEAPPPAPVAPPPPVLRFAGHVASYKSLAEAEAAWPRLAERFPVLKTANRRYVEVDLGGQRGKVVRLLVGGFPERAEALAYCRSLRGTALYCAPHDLPAG
ncbi:SPOR domain-containing protein [Ferrovibrio terrae]|uniref:SPOR domain-containing protein n=1 Tax=Ferrovibrio terrae TaxID=2594003 RepID=UPI0031381360